MILDERIAVERNYRAMHSLAIAAATQAVASADSGDFSRADANVTAAYNFVTVFTQAYDKLQPCHEEGILELWDTIDDTSHTLDILKRRAFT